MMSIALLVYICGEPERCAYTPTLYIFKLKLKAMTIFSKFTNNVIHEFFLFMDFFTWYFLYIFLYPWHLFIRVSSWARSSPVKGPATSDERFIDILHNYDGNDQWRHRCLCSNFIYLNILMLIVHNIENPGECTCSLLSQRAGAHVLVDNYNLEPMKCQCFLCSALC